MQNLHHQDKSDKSINVRAKITLKHDFDQEI
jgi:hypothetical protein